MITFLSPGQCAVRIPADDVTLPGTLAWPPHPSGIVVFAPGGVTGPCRGCDYVSGRLRAVGLATLLLDLTAEAESGGRWRLPDIDLRVRRVLAGIQWVVTRGDTGRLPLGLFGSGPGAAAALVVAASTRAAIAAVVTQGGRPDLAGGCLRRVAAPTLLLAGGQESPGLAPARRALDQLTCTRRLAVIPRGGLYFEDPASMQEATDWAAHWFVRHLVLEPSWHGIPDLEPGGCYGADDVSCRDHAYHAMS